MLAPSLRRLSIGFGAPLSDAALQSIGRLVQLRHLRVELGDDLEHLRRVLRAVPPSVQVVEIFRAPPSAEVIGMRPLLDGCDATLHLEAGGVVGLEVAGDGALCLSTLARVALQMFRAAGAGRSPQQQQLGRLSIRRLRVSPADVERPEAPEMQQLRVLLQRFAAVEVESLVLDEYLKFEHVVECIALLHGGVGELCLGTANQPRICFRLGSAAQQLIASGSSAGGSGGGAGVGGDSAGNCERTGGAAAGGSNGGGGASAGEGKDMPPLPSTATIVELALSRVAEYPYDSEEVSSEEDADTDTAAENADAEAEAEAGRGGGDGAKRASGERTVLMLLLRGPLMDALALSPSAIDSWLRDIAVQSGMDWETVQEQENATSEEPAAYLKLGLRHRSCATAVLVQCSAPEVLEELDESLWVALDALRRAGNEEAESLVECTRLAFRVLAVWGSRTAPERDAPDAGSAFIFALSEVAQDVWDGVDPSVGWSVQQRLQWIVKQWKVVRDLHPLVTL